VSGRHTADTTPSTRRELRREFALITVRRGPLIFCLLLSVFLSMSASKDQTDLVFSGVFSLVWIGEAVVTLQIKLLGGNM
jgi:hypothetical protein